MPTVQPSERHARTTIHGASRSRSASAFTLVFGLLLLAIVFAGCSLVGLGIGAIVDARKPDATPIPGWRLTTLEPGTKLNVRLANGKELKGSYEGLVPRSDDEYELDFARANLQRGGVLPDLGENAIVRYDEGKELEGVFAGIDWNALLLGPGSVPLDAIDQISHGESSTIAGDSLRVAVAEKAFPYRSEMHFRVPKFDKSADTLHVDLREVASLEIPLEKHGVRNGLIAGFTMDVAAIVMWLATEDDDEDDAPSDSGYCGCPYVRSWDGREYVVEGEAFSGSIFRAAQRTDVLRLSNLVPAGNTCRVRIADELAETDYVDEAKLLAVDHPLGTRVVPSFSGVLHTLGAPEPPVAATDFSGADVLDDVARADDRAWLSHPFGRLPSREADLRDGLIVDFAKPPDARNVKLAYRVRNTEWGAFLQTHFLALHGTGVDAWYAELNRSEKARADLQRAMIREGMLIISIWDGAAWADAGWVWEVGPNAFREEVVRLELPELPPGPLRMRLSSTPGLWSVDAVAVDYSEDAPCEVTEIAAAEAAGGRTREDLRGKLATIDGDRHRMSIGDYVDLEFVAPERSSNLERTYLLKTTGYYRSHPPETEPRPDIAARIVHEPGFFARYSLGLANERVQAFVTAESARRKQFAGKG